jgi:ribonuclease R
VTQRFTPDSLASLIGGAPHPLGLKELMRLSGLHPGQQTALKRVLRDMVREGRIQKDGKRFRVARASEPRHERPTHTHKRIHTRPRIEGTLKMNPAGFGFVHPVTQDGANVFVPPEDAARALDNDRVVVEVVRGRDGRPTGRIVDVVDRPRQMVVGKYVEAKHGAYVETDIGPVQVPKTQLARNGDAVKVRLGIGATVLSVKDRLVGEVSGAIGKMGDMSVEVLGIAYAQGFQDEFPPRAMDEADAFQLVVTDEEAHEKGRRDLRAMSLVTIDGIDARDFDDAVWVSDHPQGFRLVVAIADVSHYVTEGSALDAEALRRATSVYLPGRVLPMLPERLSNGICSLKPDEDRLCMVADLVISRAGEQVGSEIYPAVMRSAARCTYEEVQAVLSGEAVPDRVRFKPLFEKLLELSRVMTKMRLERGAIDFDLYETKVELNEADGTPKQMVRRERLESHRIVEECMLAANEAVARFFRTRGVPTVNRYHAPPDEEKLAAFAALAGAHGLKVKKGPMSSKELNALLRQLEGHPEQRALNQLLLRSMMQAVYSSENEGHYGLGAEDYLHFTSPIRRYPDLLVHRLLKQVWAKKRVDGEALEAKAVQSSERERAAMKVEREVVAFYAALMVKDRIGEELDATVSGLSEGGFFVEVDGEYIEGMVRLAGWRFDKQLYRGVLSAGKVVKVGQKARVRLSSVNLQARKIDFELLSLGPGGEVKAKPPRKLERHERNKREAKPHRHARGGKQRRR